MRERMLATLSEYFHEDGQLHMEGDEGIYTDFTEIEALNDEDLMNLYEWTVGFQG